MSRSKIKSRPKKIMGMDISEETMPDDIAGEAEKLLKAGEIRAAVSLLYRASLFELLKKHEVDLHESFTENDCLRAVKKGAPQKLASYFSELTDIWLMLAYAHQHPSESCVVDLCRDWTPLFKRSLPEAEA